jgi:hypothetical protein
MKRIFVIILVCLTLNFKAQPEPDIMIWDWKPVTVCQGGTINIRFMWNGNEGTTTFRFMLPPELYPVETFSFSNAVFPTLSHEIISSYKIYTMPFVIPDHWPTGEVWIAPYYSSPMKLYLNCLSTDLGEHSIRHSIPMYYDLQGNQVEKRYNTLLIEQVGHTRRKVFIQE